jgi:type III pantothenate kinase
MNHLSTFGAIDIGNTRIKTALFQNNELMQENYLSDLAQVLEWVKSTQPNFTIISSVKKITEVYLKEVSTITKTFFLDHSLPLPFKNLYQTPTTLGADRLAGIAGAMFFYPQKNCLVFDLGTCITIDFLNEKGEFEGGNISLGMQMRFRALHEFTSKLPYIQPSQKNNLTGKNTEQAIENGVIQGIILEIEGYIEAYKQKYTDLQVILCGGDTEYFADKIKNTIFAVPNLNLWGLYQILQYNVVQNN